jgi:hypothetical protein
MPCDQVHCNSMLNKKQRRFFTLKHLADQSDDLVDVVGVAETVDSIINLGDDEDQNNVLLDSIDGVVSGVFGNQTEYFKGTNIARRSFWGSIMREPIKNKAEAYRNVLQRFTNP